jgi:hypothetical protein
MRSTVTSLNSSMSSEYKSPPSKGPRMAGIEGNGAQGRSRTTDTAIFSRMLYQLSYLGAPLRLAAGL